MISERFRSGFGAVSEQYRFGVGSYFTSNFRSSFILWRSISNRIPLVHLPSGFSAIPEQFHREPPSAGSFRAVSELFQSHSV